MSEPSLAVVVIARNEERTIDGCLRACLASVERAEKEDLIRAADVVLVDSASTDRTREIAARLPVRVIAIPPDWPLSAAAGRFVGFRSTRSDVILFVDGDYVLDPGWLPAAVRLLTDPTIAGVGGVDREASSGRTAISRYVVELTEKAVPAEAVVETDVIPVGLFQREWIVRSGGIQPFLRGAEDRDLAIRIRALGGRLVKTRAVMGTHFWSPGRDLTIAEYLRSVAFWSYGEGQAARNARDDAAVRRLYLKRYFNVRHAIQLLNGLAAFTWAGAILAAVVVGQPVFAVLVLASGALALGAVVRGNGERLSARLFRFHQVPYVVVRLGGFALGYLDRPRAASEYPVA